MSDDTLRMFSGIDTSRRSFLQKGAVASSAVALGGTTVGWASANQHTEEDDEENEDYVLMLYPDAVEQSSATVVSDEIDWHPWDADVDNENDQEANGYRTHLAEYDFSASHVAPVFVPDDVEIDVDEEINLGEIRRLLYGPDDPIDGDHDDDVTDDSEPVDDSEDDDTGPEDDSNNGGPVGETGQAVLVEIALEDDPGENDIDDDPDDDTDDDATPDDDPDDDNGPDDEPDNDDDDGLLNF